MATTFEFDGNSVGVNGNVERAINVEKIFLANLNSMGILKINAENCTTNFPPKKIISPLSVNYDKTETGNNLLISKKIFLIRNNCSEQEATLSERSFGNR